LSCHFQRQKFLPFAATAWLLCRPSTCQNKNIPGERETIETNLSLFEISYFLLHDRQTLFESCFAGVGSDKFILLRYTNRWHFSPLNPRPCASQSFTAPTAQTTEPDADGTVSFAVIVPVVVKSAEHLSNRHVIFERKLDMNADHIVSSYRRIVSYRCRETQAWKPLCPPPCITLYNNNISL